MISTRNGPFCDLVIERELIINPYGLSLHRLDREMRQHPCLDCGSADAILSPLSPSGHSDILGPEVFHRVDGGAEAASRGPVCREAVSEELSIAPKQPRGRPFPGVTPEHRATRPVPGGAASRGSARRLPDPAPRRISVYHPVPIWSPVPSFGHLLGRSLHPRLLCPATCSSLLGRPGEHQASSPAHARPLSFPTGPALVPLLSPTSGHPSPSFSGR